MIPPIAIYIRSMDCFSVYTKYTFTFQKVADFSYIFCTDFWAYNWIIDDIYKNIVTFRPIDKRYYESMEERPSDKYNFFGDK